MTAKCQEPVSDSGKPAQKRRCIAAYASVAHALPHALARGGFVSASLARELSAAFAGPAPPLPSSPLHEDARLVALLAQLPEDLYDRPAADGRTPGTPEDRLPVDLLEAVAGCDRIPLDSVETLGDCLMHHLGDALIEHYGLAEDMARYLAAEARSEAVARAVEQAPVSRIESYMIELEAKGELSGERVLAYAQRGDSPLFYAALGRSSALDAEMVEAFIEDGGRRVLERLLLRTDFAPVMQQTILAAYAEAAPRG